MDPPSVVPTLTTIRPSVVPSTVQVPSISAVLFKLVQKIEHVHVATQVAVVSYWYFVTLF